MDKSHIGALVAIALTAGCGEPAQPEPGGLVVSIVAGEGQTDTILRSLAEPIVAQVTDSSSQPVRGALVNWVVADPPADRGGGKVFAGAALTDASGRAFERWTLDFKAGVQTLEARAVDSLGNPVVYATATAVGLPVKAIWIGLYHERVNVAVGDTAELAVVYRDQYGNLGAPCPDFGPWDRMTWDIAPRDTVRIKPVGYRTKHAGLTPDQGRDSVLVARFYVRSTRDSLVADTVRFQGSATCIPFPAAAWIPYRAAPSPANQGRSSR